LFEQAPLSALTIELPVERERNPNLSLRFGIVEEEADESAFWMELIIEDGLLKVQLVQPLVEEANELAKIMASSRISATQNLKRRANGQSAIGNRKSAITYG
jgi:hypothetical protein